MRAPNAEQLLSVWELGLQASAIHWALLLLAAASPEETPAALAQLTVGQRDARLLTLREWLFGSRLIGTVTCPACGDRLEVTSDVADLRVPAEGCIDKELSLSADGCVVRFRVPNSLDLTAIAEGDPTTARERLLVRCLLDVRDANATIGMDQLPAEVVEAITRRMDEADPQANIQLTLTCPACGKAWSCTFDIVRFLRAEVNAWAERTLREVHVLASAYGWREAEILALSASRRQMYLELAAR